jgi:type II secretory pathway pseudopilin PulG
MNSRWHYKNQRSTTHIKCINGFAYIALLVMVATIGLISVASLQLGVVTQRRGAEAELLYIGQEFQDALASYANASPPGTLPYPKSLEDLLRDPRYPGVRRHLRKIYVDPVTAKDNWVLITAPGGGIAGLHSASNLTPIKISGFDQSFVGFEGAVSYREWRFMTKNVLLR